MLILRLKHQTRNPKDRNAGAALWRFEFVILTLWICLGFRIWDLEFPRETASCFEPLSCDRQMVAPLVTRGYDLSRRGE